MSSDDKEEPNPPPTLLTNITTTPKDLTTALTLISTSISEQRQTTSRALIHSPPFLSTIASLIIPLALITEYCKLDRISATFTALAIIAATLKSVEFITAGYLDKAGGIGWGWLYGDGDEDSEDCEEKEKTIVFVSRWKDVIVGTLVLRVYVYPAAIATAMTTASKKPLIRAWTVKQIYRGNGVGRSLLRFAILHCRDNGWDDLEFADDHANCLRVLPGWVHGGLGEEEKGAREVLERELRRGLGVGEKFEDEDSVSDSVSDE